MEVEVAIPLPNPELNFDSTCSSPFMTAPSSPQRFGSLYFSAPTSPTRASAFLRELRNSRRSLSSIPFAWEEKPGVPKRRGSDQSGGGGGGGGDDDDDDYDFEFNFSGQLDRASASADELFYGGKIRPLKPPPRLQANSGDADSVMNSLPASPRSPSRFAQGKKMVQEVLSPRHPKRDFDPFSAALEETRKREMNLNKHEDLNRSRGRERKAESSSSPRTSSASYVRKGTRSLSPLRVSDIMEADREAEDRAAPSSSSNHGSSYFSSLLSSMSFSKGYRKWSFKDFLLFRSASEGRGTAKDPLRKYVALSKRSSFNYAPANDAKSSSFRSTESAGSVSSRRRSGAAPVSAHEMHYTLNRAVSEEMKKKTSLPYKHGLLGCLGFNPPPGVHDLARVLGR
ncbi:uncharacterized protein LOC115735900 [Rhodamnia argentea]|uniref:Uncharacterized protein LOC115735900 n=1 Tax=Rhodamnia argentea TaxID=178133 RepID=A0A8B8NMI8_9MYRT|nr:uncharacterized protein LOC115735900 [Rhodamnia argentea]